MPVFLLTCPGRDGELAGTLASWGETDWGGEVEVYLNGAESVEGRGGNIREGMLEVLRRGVGAAEREGAGRFLVVEDDVRFNRWLWHNLSTWPALGRVELGLLYHFGLPAVERWPGERCFAVEPRHARGAQARVFSVRAARHILAHSRCTGEKQDVQFARLAGELGPVLVHSPALVQHVGRESTWGGVFHEARDFDPDWRSS